MRRVALIGLALITALVFVAAPAEAANRRISISDYRWSDADVKIDLGEHVTWYWTGPDLMHSVTGQPPNATQWDSDPKTLPHHKIGDDYQISFDKPGVYSFQCKIHSLVRGTVTVSNTPGNPEAEPDPVPKSNVDRTAPKLRQVRLPYRFGKRGVPMPYTLNEAGRLSVDYYRYNRKGKPRFAGWATYNGHVGNNTARIGARRPHFKPKSGRYLVELRVTDEASNTSPPTKRRFRLW